VAVAVVARTGMVVLEAGIDTTVQELARTGGNLPPFLVEVLANAAQLCCGTQRLVTHCSGDMERTTRGEIDEELNAVLPCLDSASIGSVVYCHPQLAANDHR